MEKKKIDRIIEVFRNYKNLNEEMMTANPIGKGGGLGSQVDPTGKDGPPGFDPVMGFKRRKGGEIDGRSVDNEYKSWLRSLGLIKR